MRKTQIIRIILAGLFTAIFLKTAGVMIRLDTYSLVRLVQDAEIMGITDFASTAKTIQIYVWFFHYATALAVSAIVWKWLAFPESILPAFLNRIKIKRREPIEETPLDDDLEDDEMGEETAPCPEEIQDEERPKQQGGDGPNHKEIADVLDEIEIEQR